ncbi:GNAT family N-acetyltransferase [Salinarimonas ramus]|uniref:Acetyltransferase n=1 Tax=Salinarimonas ramus TaxID=690164 RepID=A0A917Q4P9_9HYPH|nr:GNAT family N-acetyltransferase [Salinarimonas ramus]GGK25531.1 acetyltransferase [Salinarimonas ramus]
MTNGLRPARPDEGLAVRDLVRAAFAIHVPRLGREPGPMGHDWPACVAAGEVSVLEDARGALAAVARLVAEPDALLVETIAVRPDLRGTGLGRRLLAFAEDEARRLGRSRLRLYTNALMSDNIALYARHGYVATHEAGEPPMRRVYMEKHVLSPPSL